MKKGYVGHIETLTGENKNFRQVVYTGEHVQLVLMRLLPGEDIGREVHHDTDQFFRIESGTGRVDINGVSHTVTDGSAVIVPAGAEHNVINDGEVDLLLYTLYAPSHHKDGIVRSTKDEAVAQDAPFDGTLSE